MAGAVVGTLAAQRDPRYWGPEPDRFDPDQFTMDKIAARPRHAFIPFSIGRRQCMAQEVSFMMLRVVLFEIYRRYRLRLAAGATVANLRAAVTGSRLAVVGLGAQTGSGHVGTLMARGDVPRRTLAGVEAVLTTGETVRAGGAMLKDVVGYDLLGALLGSAGRLAIIAAVTFRLEPAAARTPTATPPGARIWQPALADAFDPKGLLRSGAPR
jgi:hypothetical protein